MAESTGSKLAVDDQFWILNRNSDNSVGGVSIWCDEGNILSLIGKVFMGDRLEFVSRNPLLAHWGIYVGKWEHPLISGVVHFIHGSEEGRAYPDMQTYFHVSLPAKNNALVVNSIYKFVELPGGKVRINNLKDEDWPPASREHICREVKFHLKELHTKSLLGQVYKCRVLFKDSEDFVNHCRYGRNGQHYMCLFTDTENLPEWHCKENIQGLIHEVRVGDRLEFRSNSPHNHWGIYIGQWGDDVQQVVHLATDDENDKPNSAMTSLGNGSSTRDKPELLVESIGTVLGHYQVRINNESDRIWSPIDRKNILEEIKRQLPGKTYRHACKVLFKNSEDFVNYCRYYSWRINVGLVSDWCASGQSLLRLRVGDRLEFMCSAQLHSHWGIYVDEWGDDREQVVHLAPADGNGKVLFEKHSCCSGASSKNKPVGVPSVNPILEVLGNGTVRINNEKDLTWLPLVKTDILDEIKRQSPCKAHRHRRNVSFKESEEFANYCRYDHCRINFGLVSDWYDDQSLLPRLRVGDRLEFHRTAPYAHWGIYVGDWEDDHHQVVHFAPANWKKGKIFSRRKSSSSESSENEKPVLFVNNIWEVLGNDEVRINNERDHFWPPFVGKDILDEIKRQLESQSAGYKLDYHLLRNNCEHRVNHFRYGKLHSDQVNPLSKLFGRIKKSYNPLK